MNITCAHCFAINRIPEHKSHQDAKCGKCAQPVYSRLPMALNDTNFYRFIERNDLPVVVDFWASWCGPCQAMAPIFNEVASSSPSLLFTKVNTEQAQKTAADANIRSIPTLIFFYQGKEVNRISGGLNAMQMKQWLMQCIEQLNS